MNKNKRKDTEITPSVSGANCYKFILHDDNGIEGAFGAPATLWTKDQVEATYVIYLEGNEQRYEQIIEQFKTIRPTEIIWIVHNQGYEKCQKKVDIQNPPEDIVDANYTIFKHANEQGYGNILVLEDDFLFDERLSPNTGNNSHQEVAQFITNWNKLTPSIGLVYYLGTLPLLQCPIEWSHNLILLSCGAHAVLYNRTFRDGIMAIPQKDMEDWDTYINLHYWGNRYTYRVPLCYQLFPETNNSKYWGYQHPILKWLSTKFQKYNTRWFQMDTKIEPGYSVYNLVSKLLFFFLFFLVAYTIWRIVYWFLGFFIPIDRIFDQRRRKK